MIVHIRRKFLAFAALLICSSLLCCATPLMADDATSGSDWEYSASIYLWAPQMNIYTPSPPGVKVEIPFYQILNDLKMVVMTDFSASTDKWSIMTDVIYMKLRQKNIRDPQFDIGERAGLSSSVQMKSWIISPTVGYALHNSDKARVEVFGGLRYLWIDLGVQIDSNNNPIFDRSGSEGFWDGIIGMRAKVNLNEKWFMPMSIDVGGGNTKSTWQGVAGIGYNFARFNTSLTYRYLSFKFDDVPTMDKLVSNGPLLNFNFKF